jgi:hypothetical protein
VNILRRLSNLSTTVPKDGMLLVSFAGHGMERGGQAFLLPADAQISDSISFLEETAISMTRVKSWIKETGVSQVVLLLDACRNDPGGRADAPNNLSNAYVNAFNFDVRNKEVQAFATVYATGIGQRAYEYTEKRQGYFSWAVVEGLKGAAANDKGEVTLAQLVSMCRTLCRSASQSISVLRNSRNLSPSSKVIALTNSCWQLRTRLKHGEQCSRSDRHGRSRSHRTGLLGHDQEQQQPERLQSRISTNILTVNSQSWLSRARTLHGPSGGEAAATLSR